MVFLVDFVLLLFLAFGEEKKNLQMDFIVSDQQMVIFFSVFILVVVGIFVYITRDAILRKKTSYDSKDYESKKDKTYEKYHSDWQDDYEEFDKRSYIKGEEEFRDGQSDGEIPDYYSILGVSNTDSQETIKKRFRKLVKELHPDKTKEPEAEKKMAQINRAYEVLSDSELRKKYDQYRGKS